MFKTLLQRRRPKAPDPIIPVAPPLQLETGIPPQDINYNDGAAGHPERYVRSFKESACLRELPFLMRRAGLTPSSALLDYGCGMGRLAYAASKYLQDDGAFYGYEPNQTALSFLRAAYSNRRNFGFDGRELRNEEDYVAIQEGKARRNGIAAEDVDLDFIARPIDVQYSHSVFTHMWAEPIVHVLKSLKKVVRPDALCVNSWLIVDDFAAYVLRCGLADRELPHRVNGIWTYHTENPLVCAAYELADVKDIYARGGHEIVDILWGSWAGRDNGVVYQDIVISRAGPSA